MPREGEPLASHASLNGSAGASPSRAGASPSPFGGLRRGPALPGMERLAESNMMVAWFAIFFLLVFLLALGLSALFFSLREKRERDATRSLLHADPDPPAHAPPAAPRLSDFERSVLHDVYGMSEDEIRFSETLLRYRDRDGVNYVTSDERPDGFFQA